MNHSNKDKKSIILGIVEIFSFLLIVSSIVFYWGSSNPEAHPEGFMREFKSFIHRFNFLDFLVAMAPLIVFFLSIVGIIGGWLLFKRKKRKLELFIIVLSIVNLGLSLFLGWGLFGLARGL